MTKHSKQYRSVKEKVSQKTYSISQAAELIKEISVGKNPSLDLAVKLNINPQKQDQIVRGSVVLPAGTGKTKRVVVITSGDNIAKAKEAGADEVGAEDIIERIKGGWLDFDSLVVSPDMMAKIAVLGRSLGPRGLMPNPKSGTVTPTPAKAVEEIKGGKVQIKTDKNGNVHFLIGKSSFSAKDIEKNITAAIDEIKRLKPSGAKGKYIENISLSSTFGPAIKIEIG